MQHVSYMYVRLSHFLPYLRMGYCIARIRISCTFVPNVLTTEKSNIHGQYCPATEYDFHRSVALGGAFLAPYLPPIDARFSVQGFHLQVGSTLLFGKSTVNKMIHHKQHRSNWFVSSASFVTDHAYMHQNGWGPYS